jgi:hypothetical protein
MDLQYWFPAVAVNLHQQNRDEKPTHSVDYQTF